jgi:hypothetical protein
MLCSQFQMRRQGERWEDVAILPCRTWGCEYCAPRRRAQLKAMAASGLPNVCLTLTVRATTGESPVDRYQQLHRAWKVLVKRIIRQFAQPPEKRWQLTADDDAPYHDILAYAITKQVAAKKVKRLHYMAFCEETENGEPHLHILLRTKYIPQKWISQQMDQLLRSPVVWIEKIRGARSAIQYVTKYVTDAPAQFGKSRRYWYSRYYLLQVKVKNEVPLLDRRFSRRIRQTFREFLFEIGHKGKIAIPIAREQLQLYSLKDALYYFHDGTHWKVCAEILKAQIWFAHWKREAAGT